MKVRKPIFAFLIMLFLSIIMIAGIVVFNFTQTEYKADRRHTLIANNAAQSLKLLEKEIQQLNELEMTKTSAGVDMTVMVLRELTDDELVSGPLIFEDGVIVMIKDNEILYPTEFNSRLTKLDAEYLQTEPTLIEDHWRDENGEILNTVVTGRHIRDDYWYIDWTSEEEYQELKEDEMEIMAIIDDLQEAFDGYIFLFDANSPDLRVTYAKKEFEECDTAEELGLSREDIEKGTQIFAFRGGSYSANYVSLYLFQTHMVGIILINSTNALMSIIANTLTIMALIMITIMAVTLWLYWIQTYVRDQAVTESQRQNYLPKRIRRKARSIGVIGFIAFFIISGSMEALSSLSLESSRNNKNLNLMTNRMVANSDIISRYRKDEEDWMVYYAERAALLSDIYPFVQTRDFLKSIAEVIDAEYIMLFDENGKEILSSNSYIGLDLVADLVENGSSLGKLMKGSPNIVLDPTPDLLEGKTVQLIGTPVFAEDGSIIGAVVIAIDPEKSWQAMEKEEYTSFLNIISPDGNAAIAADVETGIIMYSTCKDWIGELTGEIGLYEGPAPDTELDTFTVLEDQYLKNYYGAYQRDDAYQFYYMTQLEVFENNAIPFGLACALSFLIIYWIVTSFLLKPYSTDIFNETVRVTDIGTHDLLMEESGSSEWQKLDNEDEYQEDMRTMWKKMYPERKATIFIEIALALILVVGAVRLLSRDSSFARSAIRFIMLGSWRRGFNLLSFAGIMILVLSYMVMVFIEKLLQKLIESVLDRKAETLFRLIFSFIQYAALIAVLFLGFGFLGFDTRTLLASVSVLSLAVTLGAKDLVADILAGIFIIFEDDFRVGDIIQVDGFSGIVQEIGVRSTRLIGIGDNVKIIGNQNVQNVVNLSKLNSWYSVDLKVPADQPLKDIEAMLEREFPAVGEAIPEIISGPFYKGVMSIGTVNTLYIIAECRQPNYRKVQRKLNRAILDLFEKYGYKIC